MTLHEKVLAEVQRAFKRKRNMLDGTMALHTVIEHDDKQYVIRVKMDVEEFKGFGK